MKSFLVIIFLVAVSGFALAARTPGNLFDDLNGTWDCHNEDGQKVEPFMFSSPKHKVTYNNGRRTYTAIVEDNAGEIQSSIRETGKFSLKVAEDKTEDGSGAYVLERLLFVLNPNSKNMTIGEYHQGFDPELECSKK